MAKIERTVRAASASVLVVIPTLDEATHIEEVVRCLFREREAQLAMRVVVADGGSEDGTVEIVEALAREYPELHLLHNRARIQSAGVNLAVRRHGETSDVLIRCDAHALYPAGFCQSLLGALARTGADSVVVPLDSVGSTALQRAIAWVSNSPIGTGGAAHRAGRVSGFVDHGHHAAFRMEIFRRAGGYDETFTHNEDAELDCRLRALGARIYLDGAIRVGYHPRASLYALSRQYFRYGAGRSRTLRRHVHSLRLRQLVAPAHVVLSTIALVAGPWLPPLLAWPALYVTTLAGVSLVVAARHRSSFGLLTGPAAAVMHAAWGSGFLYGLATHRARPFRGDAASTAMSSALPEEP